MRKRDFTIRILSLRLGVALAALLIAAPVSNLIKNDTAGLLVVVVIPTALAFCVPLSVVADPKRHRARLACWVIAGLGYAAVAGTLVAFSIAVLLNK